MLITIKYLILDSYYKDRKYVCMFNSFLWTGVLFAVTVTVATRVFHPEIKIGIMRKNTELPIIL